MSLQIESLYVTFINWELKVYEKGNWKISANKIDKKNNHKLWER